MKKPKYSQGYDRDWNFYLANAHKFTFAGAEVLQVIQDSEGLTAKYAFWLLDSSGKLAPCSESELLKQALTCKKSVNFHLKMWSEGYAEFGEVAAYYLAEFIDPPDWVEKAFRAQIAKSFRAQSERYPDSRAAKLKCLLWIAKIESRLAEIKQKDLTLSTRQKL